MSSIKCDYLENSHLLSISPAELPDVLAQKKQHSLAPRRSEKGHMCCSLSCGGQFDQVRYVTALAGTLPFLSTGFHSKSNPEMSVGSKFSRLHAFCRSSEMRGNRHLPSTREACTLRRDSYQVRKEMPSAGAMGWMCSTVSQAVMAER